MDRTVRATDWDKFFAGGRHDVKEALVVTPMRTGPDRTLLEIGCRMGRLYFALADHFGAIVRMEISRGSLDRATALNDRDND